MAHINHQYGGRLGLVVFFIHLQILLGKQGAIKAVVDLGIAQRVGNGNLLRGIAKLVLPLFGAGLITGSGKKAVVIALAPLFQLAKDLFQSAFANGLLAFGRYLKFPLGVLIGNVAFGFQVFDKIAHAVGIVGEAVLLIQVVEPVQRLGHIAGGNKQQLHKDLQQVVKSACIRIAFGQKVSKSVAYHAALECSVV
ncbi:hypothetical protein ADICEAN_03605 [Cesiribacter andamanensis AMV16]|uniref:Uncharacterized protein n=1 Tax=Cesiribacter andamanensis AMV16 TaxID=1279009 RepID=M7NHM4_9BACT|nr:hypothetical protein ADICEAN_03605 [Cesiribacter andamanensis AMV16]